MAEVPFSSGMLPLATIDSDRSVDSMLGRETPATLVLADDTGLGWHTARATAAIPTTPTVLIVRRRRICPGAR